MFLTLPKITLNGGFKPLKTSCRKLITEYKDSLAGSTKTSADKQHFPELLCKLLANVGKRCIRKINGEN